jgi:hypothetical protein
MPDKTPPEITTGSFVSWSGGKGRVDLVVTKGTVPGVDDEVEATEESPAARVVVWKDGKATREKVAASTHTLKRIAPLDGSEEKSNPVEALMVLGTNHAQYAEESSLPPSANVGTVAMKSAYDRGLADWPGPGATTLSPTEWALGRAAHLCKAALGEVDDTNDADLLHPAHPLAVKHAEAHGNTVIDAEQMQADLDAIMADAEVPEGH